MDAQENKDEGKSCCTKGKCCGGKALAALVLLAIGGVAGYFCGRHCATCPTKTAEAPAAAAPAAK
jgi:hypothetical protein